MTHEQPRTFAAPVAEPPARSAEPEAPRPVPAPETGHTPPGPVPGLYRSLATSAAPPPPVDPDARALAAPVPPVLQMKLAVGAPDDPLEREADRNAHTITGSGQHHGGGATTSAPSRGVGAALLGSRITSPGSGRPLPASLRGEMETSFGADFSGVRVHDTAQDRDDAESLGARAFTHRQDIWVGASDSANDRTLMAHELTHVIQQGAAVRRSPSGDAPPTPAGQAPDIQGAWYNVGIPFTDYEFDPSISGVKTAAGIVKDTAVDSAGWVKDKAVAGVEWVFDRIKDLIDSGADWLRGKFEEIKAFASTCFDTVTNGLAALIGHLTSPTELLTSAFKALDAGAIGRAWSMLRSGVALVWKGMRATIDAVLRIGTGLWDVASGFVSRLFGVVNGLIESRPFGLLPDFLQSRARALVTMFDRLWAEINAFITDLLQRLREFTNQILDAISTFADNVVSYGIHVVIDTVKKLADAWEFVKTVAADPIGFIKPHTDKLAATLNAEAPPKAVALGHEKLNEGFRQEPDGRVVAIQRQPKTKKSERSTASLQEMSDGFFQAIAAAWAGLDIGKMLLETVTNMFWPPATIRAIGHEFYELWNTDWTNAANSLFWPRSPGEGWWHDVWTNILILLDFPLALWRRVNTVLMLLMGYVTIILVVIGAIAGGVLAAPVGVLPGVIAGAGVGLEIAASIGVGLLTSYLYAEGISFIKSAVDLFTARQTDEEKERDYVQMAGSLIGMAVAILIVAILWFVSSLIGALVRGIKGKPPTPGAGKPVEPARPAEPTKPAEPVKPVEQVKPGEPPEAVKPPPKPAEKVSEVAGQPGTFKVTDASALEATKPSRLQGPTNQAVWHWELFVRLPNGEIAVFCEVNIRPFSRGSPDLNLYPKKAVVKGTGRTVTLKADFKWTTESLRLVIESYAKKFGHAPKNLGGWLAESNLKYFQNEFAKIRAAKPGLSNQQIAQEAFKAIPFGTQRIPLGYEHFHVSILKAGKVLLDDGTTQTVPTRVRVEAGTAPIKPSTVPPFAVPETAEGEGEGGDE